MIPKITIKSADFLLHLNQIQPDYFQVRRRVSLLSMKLLEERSVSFQSKVL